jgi:hypothetical protein
VPRWLKVIAGLVGIACIPIAAFGVLYSLDAGCFICLEGDAAGSAVEKGINLGLLGLVLLLLIAFIVDAIRRRKG